MRPIIFLLIILSLYSISSDAQNTMCGNGDFDSGQIDPAEWTGYYNTSACVNNNSCPSLPNLGCSLPDFTQAPANTLVDGVWAPGQVVRPLMIKIDSLGWLFFLYWLHLMGYHSDFWGSTLYVCGFCCKILLPFI